MRDGAAAPAPRLGGKALATAACPAAVLGRALPPSVFACQLKDLACLPTYLGTYGRKTMGAFA